MYPILFEYGKISISSYGACLALAFVVALHTAKKNAPLKKLSAEYIENISFWLIVSGILGARFLYTFIEHPSEYLNNPIKFFYFWEGGLAFVGGLVASIITAFVYCKWENTSFLKLTDLLSPSVAIALSIGKIGCLLMGCCQGSACDLPWAISFSHPETLAYPMNTPLHPTQIYEAFMALGLYLFLNARLKKPHFDGQIFFSFIIAFTIIRSILELFRGDPGHLGSLTTAQFLSIPMLVITVILYIRAARTSP